MINKMATEETEHLLDGTVIREYQTSQREQQAVSVCQCMRMEPSSSYAEDYGIRAQEIRQIKHLTFWGESNINLMF